MKYIVEVKYTNPAHEHVSLRRRVDSVTRLVEASNEEEALNRAANQQRALGFKIQEAKVVQPETPKSEPEQLDEMRGALAAAGAVRGVSALASGAARLGSAAARAVSAGLGKVASKPRTPKLPMTPQKQNSSMSVSAGDVTDNSVKINANNSTVSTGTKTNEEVEQVDEAKYKGLKPSTLASYASAAAGGIRAATTLARNFDDEAATQRRRGDQRTAKSNQSLSSEFQRSAKNRIRGIGRAVERLAREEVEQTDEALLPKQQAVADKLKASELAANKEKAGHKFGKSLRMAKVAAVHKSMEREMQKESVEYIEEKLTAADPASEWIKDFVASDNPKFEGKSKKERIQMALGAYYAAKRSKNEEAEKKYNEKEVKHAEKKQDKEKGSLNKIEMKPKIEMNVKGEAK